MHGMIIQYEGDTEAAALVWLRKRLKAIALTLSSALPEASVELIYSGIDTLGWLGSPQGTASASRSTFITWCDKYLVASLSSSDGIPITAIDLYAARCGVLHTSTPTSDLSSTGKAREICYQFGEVIGVNFFGSTPQDPVLLDVEHFALSFKEAALRFGDDFAANVSMASLVHSRANTFFRWGKLVS